MWYPYPPDNGSKIRIYNLLRALAQRHEVTLLSFCDAEDVPPPSELTRYCRVAGIVPKINFQPTRARALLGFFNSTPRSLVDTYNPEMARLVAREFAQSAYDLAIASQLGAALYLAKYSRPPKILEEVEVASVRELYTRAPNDVARARGWLTWTKTRAYVRSLIPNFAACTVVSKNELANLRDAAPAYQRVEIIPNGVDGDWLRVEGDPQPNTLVFNGALTFQSNYDAMSYFVRDIWHLIKMGEPSASLKITGRNDGIVLNGPVRQDVTFTGYLPDTRAAVSSAWACVVPLRRGGGTRIKILEAMALGTPVIATSKGAEGLDVTPEKNILLADEPKAFAEQTLRLFCDAELRRCLAENARRLVAEKYDWRIIGEQFNQTVQAAAEGSGR